MTQALITINTFAGSNDDLPINVLVSLDNTNNGGELTYDWTMLDEPPGPIDALSSLVIQNPTFTPKKEGSYLLQLVVNKNLPSEKINSVVAAIRQFKTRERLPAAGESIEDSALRGWADAANSLLLRLDSTLADPTLVVGSNASGGVLNRGDVLHVTSSVVIKAALPGVETVPGFVKALATVKANTLEPLYVVESDVAGSLTVANGALMRLRFLGRYADMVVVGGIVGDPVYVSNGAGLSQSPGTFRRQIGHLASISGGFADVWFTGVGTVPQALDHVARTTNLTLTAANEGTVFTNEGAVGDITFTLPSLAVTTNFTLKFRVKAAFYIKLLAVGADVIYLGSVSSAAAGFVRSNLPGACLAIEATSVGTWAVTDVTAAWELV